MHTQKIRLLFLLVCLGCLFLCSCGLDDYYVIEPPTCSNPHRMNQDDQMWYSFTATAVSTPTSAQISMKGTAVYYKLVPVSQETTLQPEIEAIKSANTEYSENGINRIKGSYARMKFGSSDFLSVSGASVNWTMELNDPLVLPSGSEQLKLLTASDGSTSIDVYVDKPSSAGDYYINAYAVTVGDVSLIEHYSELAPLGVLKFTITD